MSSDERTSRTPGTVRSTSATARACSSSASRLSPRTSTDERREVAVGEHARDEAARRLQELDAGEVALEDRARLVGELAAARACAARDRSSARRMKPMCGPQFGLVIAERALFGEPTLVRTSSTLSLRQLLAEALAHLLGHARRLLERRAGREAHVDALHRLVDVGEERARQPRGDDSRRRRRARRAQPTMSQRSGERAAQDARRSRRPGDRWRARCASRSRRARGARGSSGRPPASRTPRRSTTRSWRRRR